MSIIYKCYLFSKGTFLINIFKATSFYLIIAFNFYIIPPLLVHCLAL